MEGFSGMKLKLDNIGALQTFVHAAEKRSFREAGQIVGLSASAVGKSVQKLEEQLGVRLFHRSTRSIALTTEGKLFLERCRRVLGELEVAQAELSQSSQGTHGRLKIGLPISSTLLVSAVSAFMKAYPEVDLELDISDRFADVIDEGFDVVIRTGKPKDSRLLYKKVGEFSWCLVASPDYIARCGAPKSVADLQNHRCLRHRYSETGKIAPWELAGQDDENSRAPETFTVTTVDSIIQLVLDGNGIAMLPSFSAKSRIRDGSLVDVLPGAANNTGIFYLLWPASRYPLARVRAFLDFVSKYLTEQLA
ncbi:LysR family transcriptional regulator [Ochrobactrum soli]|uniref:LysR family transcriptional regulator n=1 Tax=Ochrobactrum soli TaxID=2448455 RepID=UPI002E2C3731|nr:LysR family transcriptional regulator [[Ochrobactrum] soli]